MIASATQSVMSRTHIVLALLLGLSFFCTMAVADTSVWRVSKEGQQLYVGGTVHLLRPSDYPLPPEFEQAYDDSDTLVFETDISSMTDMSVQAQMLQQLTYSGDQSLKTVLNEEAYSALSEYVSGIGLPLQMLEKFKPGMLISTLQVMEFQRIGFTPQGVDAFFNTRAMGDGKATGELESIEDQIGFLASMGEGNESEFVLISLKDLEDTSDSINDMVAAWRAGSTAQLASMFVDEMRSEAPEIYDLMLRQRNLNWLPQLLAMLETEETEFVLVGAAHLVGPDGLLEMLEARGYQVQQL